MRFNRLMSPSDHGSKFQPRGSDVQVVGKKSPKGHAKGLRRSSMLQGESSMDRSLAGSKSFTKAIHGCVIEKAKVRFVSDRPSSSLVLSSPAMFHRETVFRRSPDMGMTVNAGSEISGTVTGFRSSKFKQGMGRVRAQNQFGNPTGAGTKMGLYPNVLVNGADRSRRTKVCLYGASLFILLHK
jgi:hypothetical protein